MRQLATSVVLGVVFAASVGSLTACDAPYNPDRPAIDPNAPRIHIITPERGTFAGEVSTIEVRGTVFDDTLVTSVTVNDRPAVVHEDGSFEVTVPVQPGTNLLHAVAKDPEGNTGKETRAVVAGKLSPMARKVPSGITATLSAQTFDALGRGAGTYFAGADIGALLAPANPVVDSGTTNGEPDCLYAQAFVTAADVVGADIKLIPQALGLDLDITLTGVSTDMHTQWAVACIDGSRNVHATADKIRIKGLLTLAIASGKFNTRLVNTDVTVTNFQADLGGIPGSIVDMLDLDTRLGPVLAWAAERYLVPKLNDSLNALNETNSVDLLGKTIDITVAPARIQASVAGLIVDLDTELRAQGDTESPGFVYVKNTLPAMDERQGFQLAVADDAANQLLGSFWAAKGMEINLDLATGSYGDLGRLYDRVELSAKVPPHLDATGDRLRLTIGDFLATFRDQAAVATAIAINAQVDLRVVKDPDGKLRLDVGTPVVYVDILDENVDGSNPLSSEQFEALTTFAASRIVAFGSDAIGVIPLPSVGGVSMQNVSVQQQTGYVIVDGEIQ